MRTAIDTNVIVALWDANEKGHLAALDMLDKAAARGGLLICGAVFGELLAGPDRSEKFVDEFVRDAGITVDWSSTEAVWREAGSAFHRYVASRKQQRSGVPRRILTDFYIGAHAFENRYTLLTLDDGIYRAAFPKLRIERV